MTAVYPPGPCTRYGRELMLSGTVPQITYTSGDRSRIFHHQGGLAPIPGVQDGLVLQSISGITPPFKHLDSQGAREDGTTWNDTVYDPAEIDATFEASANSPEDFARMIRDWVAANDPKVPGRLEYFTPDLGLWWADVRLMNNWPDQYKYVPRQRGHCTITHTWRNDHAFWRSVDSVNTFRFAYNTMSDSFTTDHSATENLGTSWPQYYIGSGGGYCYSKNGMARWRDDPDDQFTTLGREVVNGPYAGFNTATDNQVIDLQLGSFPEISFPDNAETHIWGRMGRTGSAWNGNGVKVQIGFGLIKLSRFNNFVETTMATRPILIPPLLGEGYTLVCGYEGNPRLFKVLRNGFEVLSYKEQSTGSVLNSSHRGIGFGMRAGAALITQATPAAIRYVSAGDNAKITQAGFSQLTNIGSENGWPRFLCYGPGTFEIGNGPNNTEMVKFGPLLDGQIAMITTQPRLRSVVDVTPGSLPDQVLNPGQNFLNQLIKLVTFNRVPPLLSWFESMFGIRPPQGPLYSLLTGRFSRPIPGVHVPSEAVTSQIAVKIKDGNANSKIVAAVTPMRRWPE